MGERTESQGTAVEPPLGAVQVGRSWREWNSLDHALFLLQDTRADHEYMAMRDRQRAYDGSSHQSLPTVMSVAYTSRLPYCAQGFGPAGWIAAEPWFRCYLGVCLVRKSQQ